MGMFKSMLRRISDRVLNRYDERGELGRNVRPASEDPYGDPADRMMKPRMGNMMGRGQFGSVKPASQDPYGDPADQPHDGARPPEVPAVRGEVLGDEDDLLRPQGRDLVQHVALGARPLAPPKGRDGAEPAGPIAAFGNLHIRPRRARRGARQLEQVAHALRLPAAQHDIDERALAGESDDRVGFRQRGGQLVAVALGHATGDDHPGTGLAQVG